MFCCSAPIPRSISQPPSFPFYSCVLLQRSNNSINQSTTFLFILVFCCSAPIPRSISQPPSYLSLRFFAALQHLNQSVNHLPFYSCVLLQRSNTSINQSTTFLFILVFCCSAPIPPSISQTPSFFIRIFWCSTPIPPINQSDTFLFILMFCCSAPIPPSISQPPSFLSLCSVAALQYLSQSVNHLSIYPCVLLQRSNTSVNQSTTSYSAQYFRTPFINPFSVPVLVLQPISQLPSYLSLCFVAALQYLDQSVNHLPVYPCVLLQRINTSSSVNHLPIYLCVFLQRSNTSINQSTTFLFILVFCCSAPILQSISQPPSCLSLCSVAALR